MVLKDFILQGFSSKTHAEAVRRVFDVADLQQAILSIAFVNEEGVNLIEESLKPIANKLIIFAGIRNDITSRQGLSRLLKIGVSVYIVDTGARNILFHPKLYIARGKNEARVVIGSANLTLGGLNNNIEAGISLDLDLTDKKDVAFVKDMEGQILELPSRYPENIVLIQSQEELEHLQNTGRLLDELESLPPRPVFVTSKTSEDPISRIKLNVKRIPRSVKKMRLPSKEKAVPTKEDGVINPTRGMYLLWSSKSLTERDLNIPSATNTHATGSISLDKGMLDEGIDHREYFRKTVFADLEWVQSSDTVEETEANFQLVVKGISYGIFTLRIAHTFGTTSKAYKQHNAMTRLSWGSARENIARQDLIDRTLSLYKDETQENKFILEID